jgi:hypothetical protein
MRKATDERPENKASTDRKFFSEDGRLIFWHEDDVTGNLPENTTEGIERRPFNMNWKAMAIAAVILFMCTANVFTYVWASGLNGRLASSQSDLNDLTLRYNELSTSYSHLNATRSSVSMSYEDLSNRYNTVYSEYMDLRGTRDAESDRISRFLVDEPVVATVYNASDGDISNQQRLIVNVSAYNVGNVSLLRMVVHCKVNSEGEVAVLDHTFYGVGPLEKRYVNWDFSKNTEVISTWADAVPETEG